MSTGVVVRTLTAAELGAALELSSTAGWNQRLSDWQMLLKLSPAGSFAAVHEDRIVGTAIGIDYGTFGWIAMMLVDPNWRGQGIGAQLLEAAMRAVPQDRPIRLDATPLGRALYERYGFQHESRLTRHVARSSSRRHVPDAPSGAPEVHRLTAGDLSRVTARDDVVFGASRRVLLEWLLEGSTGYAHVTEAAGDLGYCFGRAGRLFDQIGPVVASDENTARALAGASLAAALGRAVVVDAFDTESWFAAWLQDCGFSAERPLFRMCRPARHGCPGDRVDVGCREIAILGPEFG